MDEQDHHYYGADEDDLDVIYKEEVEEYTPNFSPELHTSMNNPPGPCKIAAPLVEEEVRLIMERYVENYEIYHHNFSGGGRQGYPVGSLLFLDELTNDVNALGYGLRSSKQIDQKIRDELKIVKRYENALKTEAAKTGGGIAKLPPFTNVQKFVHEALESKPRCDDFVNECVIENDQENKPPRKKVKLLDASEEKNRNLHIKEDLLAGVIRVINLKLDNLRKERELLEIKLDYWKKKASV
ncbi:hypothetical protein ANCCAN_13933 [Ancylostoma caninum]|uniref:Uncharacterized protein n=1 Tax=Ancylostoma caninum TaxID=29170 RepID=A0A368G729_ANCCA|nr:hypothetical protein ANCCAN_13933 [Ancylostoma caninum]